MERYSSAFSYKVLDSERDSIYKGLRKAILAKLASRLNSVVLLRVPGHQDEFGSSPSPKVDPPHVGPQLDYNELLSWNVS